MDVVLPASLCLALLPLGAALTYGLLPADQAVKKPAKHGAEPLRFPRHDMSPKVRRVFHGR